MANRRYIVTFKYGTKYSLMYKRMLGANKDEVYGRACGVYGFINIAGVYVDNDENVNYYKTLGFKELV